MIVNPYSISALAIDALSVLLALSVLILGSGLTMATARPQILPGEVHTRLENRFYLVFWMGVVLLTIRLAMWPFFYFTLKSFVSEIEGAMCTFGVTKVIPTLTNILELLKPVTFFLGGLWLVLYHLHRKAGVISQSGGGKIILPLLLITAFIGATDAAGSIWLWIEMSPELAISCCTVITDIPKRFTVLIPQAIWGPTYQQGLWPAYYAGNLITIAVLARLFWEMKKARPLKFFSLAGLFTIALANCIVSVFSFVEVLGPRLMGLSFHHCLYCLLELVTDAPIFLGLLVLGTFAALGIPVVYLLSVENAEPGRLKRIIKKMVLLAGICLAVSLEMVNIHLLAQ